MDRVRTWIVGVPILVAYGVNKTTVGNLQVIFQQWEAFTVPELQNFLRILNKEEKEKVQQVQKKYDAFRQHLQEALTHATMKPL